MRGAAASREPVKARRKGRRAEARTHLDAAQSRVELRVDRADLLEHLQVLRGGGGGAAVRARAVRREVRGAGWGARGVASGAGRSERRGA